MGLSRGMGRYWKSAIVAAVVAIPTPTVAEDTLLSEVVDFTGQVLALETGVPGLIIGATRGGETAVFGFGETSDGSGSPPDGNTLMRVGSITKVFTGAVLASLVADGTVSLTDTVGQYLHEDAQFPAMGERPIRLIDLATHTSGLPREVDRPEGTDGNPFSTLTEEAYYAALASEPQLFPAGAGGLYSNFGFDMLALALERAAGKPYEQVLAERILEPLGLSDTMLRVSESEHDRLMRGHGFQGEELPDVPTPAVMAGASGLYSTADDILKWLQWHLDSSSDHYAETLMIDHAAYVWRDGLEVVYGLDESGEMDAMALGWVVMAPEGNRPLILQKAGGLQGMFLYHAFAPTRDVGVFVAINEFDFGASATIAEFANDLITQLAPR
ncbi:D-alanyl-D-alanine-carboxypeptidase/endopeptidase AmpH [Devosia albogilva]|uniref:D-alanyl-D-alanine-carboxypeptidase/endopeptidase AmpH n=1 Tax=Devosia albogilva TaxID=429726 RepID=A0ABW5QFF5_9HYPH